jgi:hypothetical protein
LSCDERIVETVVPVSVSADNLLLVKATFYPSNSSGLGVADVMVSCKLAYSKPARNPSVMAYTSVGDTVIGQFFDGIQSISLIPSSEVTMTSWHIASVLVGAGNRTEILVLFKAFAPVTVILNAQVKDSVLQGSFTLLHTPSLVRPNALVLPLPFGLKLYFSSSRILPTCVSIKIKTRLFALLRLKCPPDLFCFR